MNVLSLFDGMSCGQIALNRAGIKYNKYYASEIDKYAMAVTQYNYPNTIQLGDVRNVRAADLPHIKLLMGGSPCQGFSFAGKQLNFDDSRSKLFFEFVRLKDEIQPEYFLLENVKMKKEYEDTITKYMGVKPIFIDSSLVSGQSRKRLYWTNIPNITQPEDKSIFLKDIIENGSVDRHKSYCLDANYFKGGCKYKPQRIQAAKINMVLRVGSIKSGGQGDRIYSPEGKAISLSASSGGTAGNGNMLIGDERLEYRKLTPLECERLQTVPEGYTSCVSNSQRYKMLGNGWTVDVIVHILRHIPND